MKWKIFEDLEDRDVSLPVPRHVSSCIGDVAGECEPNHGTCSTHFRRQTVLPSRGLYHADRSIFERDPSNDGRREHDQVKWFHLREIRKLMPEIRAVGYLLSVVARMPEHRKAK